jgi:RecQ family ATP-dependent DNA helicase
VHKQRELSRIVIDEAHCISEWGHDFRPSFKQLSFFKAQYPDIPLMCLTATATSRVRNDIISTLGLQKEDLRVFAMTVSRQNLHYEIRFTSDSRNRFDDFYAWLCRVYNRRRQRIELEASGDRVDGVSGIIYTLFRRDCESLAAELRARGVGAKPFHAGLSKFEKDETLRGWINDGVGYDIIVATTAFGMGINKENVRFVIHWQIPKSFEGYYQEAGRAGRDGKAAMCCMVCIMTQLHSTSPTQETQ